MTSAPPATQSIPYACPDHPGRSLDLEDGGYRCPECAVLYTHDHGIPRFVREEVYWGEFPPETSEQLLDAAENSSWREATDIILGHRPELQEYILDERRANHLNLLPTTHRGRLLDIGTGWGCIASAASRLFEEVYTLEAVNVRTRFSGARFRQEGLTNVFLSQASVFEPPFPDASFDVVQLNGVLEWIGDWNRSVPPREAQLATLRRMGRLLRPGGILVVGIENRIGYSYLLGRRDHKDVWGTNLLPRWAASRVFRRRLGEDYRVYTYSLRGYRKLLREGGYPEVEAFAPLPNYNRPFEVLSLRDSLPLSDYLSRRGANTPKKKIGIPAARLASRLGLLKHVVPDFHFLARKPEGP